MQHNSQIFTERVGTPKLLNEVFSYVRSTNNMIIKISC